MVLIVVLVLCTLSSNLGYVAPNTFTPQVQANVVSLQSATTGQISSIQAEARQNNGAVRPIPAIQNTQPNQAFASTKYYPPHQVYQDSNQWNKQPVVNTAGTSYQQYWHTPPPILSRNQATITSTAGNTNQWQQQLPVNHAAGSSSQHYWITPTSSTSYNQAAVPSVTGNTNQWNKQQVSNTAVTTNYQNWPIPASIAGYNPATLGSATNQWNQPPPININAGLNYQNYRQAPISSTGYNQDFVTSTAGNTNEWNRQTANNNAGGVNHHTVYSARSSWPNTEPATSTNSQGFNNARNSNTGTQNRNAVQPQVSSTVAPLVKAHTVHTPKRKYMLMHPDGSVEYVDNYEVIAKKYPHYIKYNNNNADVIREHQKRAAAVAHPEGKELPQNEYDRIIQQLVGSQKANSQSKTLDIVTSNANIQEKTDRKRESTTLPQENISATPPIDKTSDISTESQSNKFSGNDYIKSESQPDEDPGKVNESEIQSKSESTSEKSVESNSENQIKTSSIETVDSNSDNRLNTTSGKLTESNTENQSKTSSETVNDSISEYQSYTSSDKVVEPSAKSTPKTTSRKETEQKKEGVFAEPSTVPQSKTPTEKVGDKDQPQRTSSKSMRESKFDNPSQTSSRNENDHNMKAKSSSDKQIPAKTNITDSITKNKSDGNLKNKTNMGSSKKESNSKDSSKINNLNNRSSNNSEKHDTKSVKTITLASKPKNDKNTANIEVEPVHNEPTKSPSSTPVANDKVNNNSNDKGNNSTKQKNKTKSSVKSVSNLSAENDRTHNEKSTKSEPTKEKRSKPATKSRSSTPSLKIENKKQIVNSETESHSSASTKESNEKKQIKEIIEIEPTNSKNGDAKSSMNDNSNVLSGSTHSSQKESGNRIVKTKSKHQKKGSESGHDDQEEIKSDGNNSKLETKETESHQMSKATHTENNGHSKTTSTQKTQETDKNKQSDSKKKSTSRRKVKNDSTSHSSVESTIEKEERLTTKHEKSESTSSSKSMSPVAIEGPFLDLPKEDGKRSVWFRTTNKEVLDKILGSNDTVGVVYFFQVHPSSEEGEDFTFTMI